MKFEDELYEKVRECVEKSHLPIKRVSIFIELEETNPALNELYKSLIKGIVKFQYKKQDGSIRTALGTLSPNLLDDSFNHSGRRTNPGIMKYYDLEKKGWRCFHKKEFIGIISKM